VEFQTAALATRALEVFREIALDGRRLQVGRPNGYINDDGSMVTINHAQNQYNANGGAELQPTVTGIMPNGQPMGGAGGHMHGSPMQPGMVPPPPGPPPSHIGGPMDPFQNQMNPMGNGMDQMQHLQNGLGVGFPNDPNIALNNMNMGVPPPPPGQGDNKDNNSGEVVGQQQNNNVENNNMMNMNNNMGMNPDAMQMNMNQDHLNQLNQQMLMNPMGSDLNAMNGMGGGMSMDMSLQNMQMQQMMSIPTPNRQGQMNFDGNMMNFDQSQMMQMNQMCSPQMMPADMSGMAGGADMGMGQLPAQFNQQQGNLI